MTKATAALALGNAITLLGKETEEGVFLWLTSPERSPLVTFHYTGKAGGKGTTVATGKVSLFQGHQRLTGGEWALHKVPEEGRLTVRRTPA